MINLVFHIVKLFSPRRKKFYSFIYSKTGVRPRDLSLYYQALTHKSAAKSSNRNNSDYNERLEFLGDALLSAIVADVLFKKFPNSNEGDLTQMRSRMVSRSSLNDVALKLGLHDHIMARTHKDLADTHIPGDSLEALIGAVYLDRGYNYCRLFVTKVIIGMFIDLRHISRMDSNYKSRLIEWGHKNHHPVDFVTDIKGDNDEQSVIFVAKAIVESIAIGVGEGLTKKEAQQMAALNALDYVDNNPSFFCSCCDIHAENEILKEIEL